MKKIGFFFILILFSTFLFSQIPIINVQPVGITKCVGGSDSLSITATSTLPLSYQWKKIGNPSFNQTTNPFYFSPIAISDTGKYFCIVSNTSGSIQSETILVQVLTIPVVTTQPQNKTICEGGNALFYILNDGINCNYEWYHDGVIIPNVSTGMYSVGSADLADNGLYICKVINACGSDTSTAALLTVKGLPHSVGPYSQGVCLGNNTSFTVNATGSDLNYQWLKNDTILVGENSNSLLLSTIDSLDKGTYSCTIWNTCDTITSSSAILTVNTKPVITGQPYNLSGCSGDSIKFITTATEILTTSYLWYFQNNPIGGALTHTLTINNITSANDGIYKCFIGNTCGYVYTNDVTLNVKLPPSVVSQPEGSIVCSGDIASFSVKVNGEPPFTYQWRLEGVNISDTTTINNISTINIPGINIGDAGIYTCLITNECNLTGILTDTAILIVKTPPAITNEPINTTVCEADTLTLYIQSQGTDTLIYNWSHNGSIISTSNTNNYTNYSVTPADTGIYICYVSNSCSIDTSLQVKVTIKSLPKITTQIQDISKCVGENVTFNITASGEQPLTYYWLKNGTSNIGVTNSYSINGLADIHEGGYSCGVHNTCGDDTSNVAILTVNSIPFISANLHDSTKCAGASVSYKVIATGESLSYKWYRNNSVLTGETGTILFFNNLSTSNSGDYKCTVENNCGIKSTNTIILTVNPTPNVNLGSDISHCNGETVTLSSGIFTNGIYNWNNNLAHTPSITVNTSDIFILNVWINSCQDSDTIKVTFNDIVTINLGDDVVSCGNHIIDAGVVTTSYNWNNGLGSEKTFTVSQTGTYTLVINASSGCPSYDTIHVTISPIPVFSLGPDTSIELNDILVLSGPSGFSSYIWNGNIVNQTVEFDASQHPSGLYSYSLQVENIWGCKATDGINIIVLPDGIDNLETDKIFCIYPIPSSGTISINLKKEIQKFNIEIINSLGKSMFSENYSMVNYESIIPVDLSYFSKGNYLIKLFSQDKYYIKKIIVE